MWTEWAARTFQKSWKFEIKESFETSLSLAKVNMFVISVLFSSEEKNYVSHEEKSKIFPYILP